MNTLTTDIPPGAAQTAASSPDFAIGFQMVQCLPALENFDVGYPKGNLVAALILNEMIQAQLRNAGIKVSEGAIGGPLNDCAGAFTVNDWRRSVAVLRAIFKNQIWRCYTIELFWYDAAESIWRSVDTDKPAHFRIMESAEAAALNTQANRTAIDTLGKLKSIVEAWVIMNKTEDDDSQGMNPC